MEIPLFQIRGSPKSQRKVGEMRPKCCKKSCIALGEECGQQKFQSYKKSVEFRNTFLPWKKKKTIENMGKNN